MEIATFSGAFKILTIFLVSRKISRQVTFCTEHVFSAVEPVANGILLQEEEAHITTSGQSPLASGLEVMC